MAMNPKIVERLRDKWRNPKPRKLSRRTIKARFTDAELKTLERDLEEKYLPDMPRRALLMLLVEVLERREKESR